MIRVFILIWISGKPRLHASSLFPRDHQLLRHRNLEPVAASPAEDWPSDSVQLRSLVLLNVFLHGTAHVSRHSHNPCENCPGINLGPLRDRNSTSLSHTRLEPNLPGWIGDNLTRASVGSRRGKRKRSKKHQLAPHQRRLIVDEAARKADSL